MHRSHQASRSRRWGCAAPGVEAETGCHEMGGRRRGSKNRRVDHGINSSDKSRGERRRKDDGDRAARGVLERIRKHARQGALKDTTERRTSRVKKQRGRG